jgi:hypothetical protein
MTQEFISITDGCAIRDTARLAAGAIYDAIQE